MPTSISPAPEPARSRQRPWKAALAETLLVFAVFAAFGGRPIPDDNEAHYLGKAKHYWNPEWCRGDFFLPSADAHHVFYWTIGWMTLCLPLSTVGWIGRCVAWLLLAIGWRRMHRAAGGPPWTAWLSAGLFAILCHVGQMANEWVVGGVEAKVFAWAFIFLAVECALRDRWMRVWLWLGAATAFHIVVGGWATLLTAFVWCWCRPARANLSVMWPGLISWVCMAGPFIYLGMGLSADADAATVAQANQIHYFERIHHHLNPFKFEFGGVIQEAVLWLAFLAVAALYRRSERLRRLQVYVWGAGAVSSVGLLIAAVFINQPAVAAGLLRFYWFRAGEVFLPIGFAVTVVIAIWSSPRLIPIVRQAIWLASALAIGVVGFTRATAEVPRADSKISNPEKGGNFDDWREICNWARLNTPPGSVFMTPAVSGTFKFYAERGEVTTWKDVPQDATRVVEWWHRMRNLHLAGEGEPAWPGSNPWRISLASLGDDRLTSLAKEYRADYVVVVKLRGLPKLNLPLVHENDHFAIYRF